MIRGRTCFTSAPCDPVRLVSTIVSIDISTKLPLTLQALLAALPDAVTSAIFVTIWVSPFLFGIGAVKAAMLTMLVEFFLVHATGFYNGFGANTDWTRSHRWLALGGLTSFYVVMIGAFAWAMDAWWMLLAFGWLFVGKLSWLLKKPSDDQTMQAMAAWAGMVVVYLFACFFTIFADLPYLGIKPELVATFGLDPTSEGVWESEPHRVVAFGALYFGVLALAKLCWPLIAAAWRNKKT